MKRIAVQVNDELHMKIKITAAKRGKSVKDYIVELVEKDFKEEK